MCHHANKCVFKGLITEHPFQWCRHSMCMCTHIYVGSAYTVNINIWCVTSCVLGAFTDCRCRTGKLAVLQLNLICSDTIRQSRAATEEANWISTSLHLSTWQTLPARSHLAAVSKQEMGMNDSTSLNCSGHQWVNVTQVQNKLGVDLKQSAAGELWSPARQLQFFQ